MGPLTKEKLIKLLADLPKGTTIGPKIHHDSSGQVQRVFLTAVEPGQHYTEGRIIHEFRRVGTSEGQV